MKLFKKKRKIVVMFNVVMGVLREDWKRKIRVQELKS